MRRYTLKSAMVLWLIALTPGSMADTLWRAVDVDRNKIGVELSTVPSSAPSLQWCATVCDGSPTCLSWNFENQVCTLTDLMVSPLHEALTSDTVKFYTRMKSDFSVGSIVTASVVGWNPAYATNLANGIYNKKTGQTCYGADTTIVSPWVLVEIQSSQNIKEIRITMKTTGNADFNPNGAEIKVGSTRPTTAGDFSSYKLFGKLPESVENSATYTVKSMDGITGQFVSIQKKSSDHKQMAFCYIFIN